MTSSSDRRLEYISRNVETWTKINAEFTGPSARAAWAKEELALGVFGHSQVRRDIFGDVAGLDVVELGCGTAYVSAWFARKGARPVGVDPTPAQLATARQMQEEFGLEFPLVQAAAESVPLPDASFDFAVSEYGASIWADPYLWIPEAARLLRPDGRLVFLCNSPLSILCMRLDGIDERLQRPQVGMTKIEWPDTGEVEFHPPHGEWIDVLRSAGFEVERLIELYAPDEAKTHEYYSYVTAEWARKWPAEEIWVARKRA
jgi:ubiquinone/menaquinone biosynthesis C-methylase UbiE